MTLCSDSTRRVPVSDTGGRRKLPLSPAAAAAAELAAEEAAGVLAVGQAPVAMVLLGLLPGLSRRRRQPRRGG